MDQLQGRSDELPPTQPDVSVVLPVWNAMPYLVTCLSSVMEQSLGRDRVQLVAVDDGSIDGSAEQLDLLAASWPSLVVVHQENSGGASRPRNVALQRVTGRFVFFLDAVDYLAPEALARMVALADESGASLVTCKRDWVGGQKGIANRETHVPRGSRPRHEGIGEQQHRSLVRASQTSAEWTPVVMALSDCKHLFRSELIKQRGLQFPEGVHFGEDTAFSKNYRASSIAVVDDYVCYFERLRDDGNNITTLLHGSEMHIDSLEQALLIRRETVDKDWLRESFIRDSVLDMTEQVFTDGFENCEPEVRRGVVQRAGRMLDEWWTPRMAKRLPTLDGLKVELIRRRAEPELRELVRVVAAGQRGKDVVDDGRVYGGFPFFRDPVREIPDQFYDLTRELQVCHRLESLTWDGTRLRVVGHAYLEHVDTVDVTTSLVLRELAGRAEHRRPVQPKPTPELGEVCGLGRYDYSLAGFELSLDLADLDGRPLAPGTWGVFLVVGAQGVSRDVPFGGNRAASIGELEQLLIPASAGSASATTISGSFSKYGRLTLAVSG